MNRRTKIVFCWIGVGVGIGLGVWWLTVKYWPIVYETREAIGAKG